MIGTVAAREHAKMRLLGLGGEKNNTRLSQAVHFQRYELRRRILNYRKRYA